MKKNELRRVALRRFTAMFLLGVVVLTAFTYGRIVIPLSEWLVLLLFGGTVMGTLGAVFGAFLDLGKKTDE